MDNDVQYEAPPSPIHLDRFQHQGLPTIDPNLSAEDIARLCFPIVFLFENAYNIQRRMEEKFQPQIDWMQFPLDIKEEEVTCPLSKHQESHVASTTFKQAPPTGIKVLPSPKWK